MYLQQGDVIIKRVSVIKGKKLNHRILAEGEVTGHKHEITSGDIELYEDNVILYLRVNSENAVLTHQEHKEIVIPQGDYQVDNVREFDHFAEEARNVRD